jgi:GNAT superfamily N-acetyltransferase
MDSKIEIINYSDDYLNDVICLLKIALMPGFSKDRWLWLHEKNVLAPSFVLLAKFEDKIVGIYAVIKKKILLGDKTLIAGRDIDPVVHPEFRGKGIFSMLLKEAKSKANEIDLFFNFANSLSQPGFVKHGWRIVYFNKLIFVNMPIISNILNFWKGLFYQFNGIGNLTVIKTNSIEDFHFEADDLIFDGDIYVNKTREYLNWRYTLNPDKKYEYYLINKPQKSIGLLICSVERKKMTILEVLCIKGFSKVQLLRCFLLNLNHLSIKSKYIVTWSKICFHAESTMIGFKRGNYLIRANDQVLEQKVLNLCFEMGPGESEFK